MRDYDPSHDLYEVLGLSPDTEEDGVRARLAQLRAAEPWWLLDEAAAVLLQLDHRTRYDAQRAAYRLRRMMRASLAVFVGRASAPSEGEGA